MIIPQISPMFISFGFNLLDWKEDCDGQTSDDIEVDINVKVI